MTREDRIYYRDEIKKRWPVIMTTWTGEARQGVNHKPSYICPICGHGKGGDGVGEVPGSENVLKCFGCGTSGDIISFWRKCNPSRSYNDSLEDLAKLAGVILPTDFSQEDGRPGRTQPAAVTTSGRDPEQQPAAAGSGEGRNQQLAAAQPGKYSELIRKASEDVDKATDYLHDRGFEDWFITAFQIGYIEKQWTGKDSRGKNIYDPVIIIPYPDTSGSYYIARTIEGKKFFKPPTKDAGPEPVFNLPALRDDKAPCFVCESQLDALSITQAGGLAIALGGGGTTALYKALDNQKRKQPLVLCLDNDGPGMDNTDKIAAELRSRNIPFCISQFLQDVKDANDYLRKYGTEALAAEIQKEMKAARRKLPFIPHKVGDYLKDDFDKDINYFRKYSYRKTGFDNLDRYVTLYPGLAVLGGASSVGKTSFCVALADNLARAGETILYFALEQEPIELVSKLLARRLFDADPNTRLTNIDIKNGAYSQQLEAIKECYAEEADNFVIVQCNFRTTAEDIRGYAESFIKDTGKQPVVIVDYVQLIAPPEGFRPGADPRVAIDHSIKEFKDMQRANELLVIMISSFNRTSYDTPASFEDFKESGMIEYTCDYVWTLQLAIQDTDEYCKAARGDKKRKSDLLHEAMTENPKKVMFVSLKSRNGKQAYKCNFDYYMQFDAFRPTVETTDEPAEEGDEDNGAFSALSIIRGNRAEAR